MKFLKKALFATGLLLLLAGCGKKEESVEVNVPDRDITYKMGEALSFGDIDLQIVKTEVIENEFFDQDEEEDNYNSQYLTAITVNAVNHGKLAANFKTNSIEVYSKKGETPFASTLLFPTDLSVLLPDYQYTTTITIPYEKDETLYFLYSGYAFNQDAEYFGVDVKKNEVIEKEKTITGKPLSDLAGTVKLEEGFNMGELSINVHQGGMYERTSTYDTNGLMDKLFSGNEITLQNNGSKAIDLAEYEFLQLDLFEDGTISTVTSYGKGSEADDILELSELEKLKENTEEVTTLIREPIENEQKIKKKFILILGPNAEAKTRNYQLIENAE